MKVIVYCRGNVLGLFTCSAFVSGEPVEYRLALRRFRYYPELHDLPHEITVVEE